MTFRFIPASFDGSTKKDETLYYVLCTTLHVPPLLLPRSASPPRCPQAKGDCLSLFHTRLKIRSAEIPYYELVTLVTFTLCSFSFFHTFCRKTFRSCIIIIKQVLYLCTGTQVRSISHKKDHFGRIYMQNVSMTP